MKGKKYIVPLLLAGVTASGYVTNITQNVSVDAATEEITNIVGQEIKLPPFAQDTYEIGDPVYLPVPDGITLAGTNADVVKYTVTKGGKALSNADLEFDTTKKQYYFTADYWGYYNIDVAIENAGQVTSKIEDLSIFVTQNDATINLPINSSRVIPAKIGTNQANFEIPAPTVTIDEEKKTALELGTQLEVKLVGPTDEDGTVLTLDNQGTKDFYKVNPNLLTTPGTYQIVYTYYNEQGKYVTSLDSNFQVVKNYDPSKIKLTMTFLDELDATGNVNADISVPRVKVTESASSLDSINAQVIVTVQNVKKPNQVVAFDEKNYTFKPTEPGFYSVTYQAKIGLFSGYEGCTTQPITLDTIMEVSDKEAPVVIPTYEYEITDGAVTKVNNTNVEAKEGKTAKEVAEEMLVNRSVEIPAVAIKGQEFTIPAAYATDNYYQYKGEGTNDIVITRTYKDGSAVSTVTTPANKKATIKFNETGKNEIRYRAKDDAGNDLGEVVYTVQVYDSLADLKNGETKINLNVGTDVVTYREDKLTFSKPTAKDTYDDNIEVRTFYIVETTSGDRNAVELTETTKDGKYEISVEDDILVHETETVSVTGLRVYSEAYVDTTLAVGSDDTDNHRTNGQLVGTNKVTSDIHKITFVGKNYDKDLPSVELVSGDWASNLLTTGENASVKAEIPGGVVVDGVDAAGNALAGGSTIKIGTSDILYAPFDQGEKSITLPSVKFFDSDSHLSTSVTIQNINGTTVSDVSIENPSNPNKTPVKDGEQNVIGYDYVISGLKVKLSYAGLYVVTYRAEDIVGNVTVKSFGFKVNDKTAPTIIIEDEDEFGKDIQVGEYFKVPTPSLVKDGQTVGGDVEWEIYKTSGTAKYKESANGFTPLSEGTFFIRYYGTDETLNKALLEDSTFVITAKDTEAPEIKLVNGTVPATRAWNPATGKNFVAVNIPVAYASDILTKKDVEVVCTVTTPSGTKISPTVSSTDPTKLTFNASSEGVYTVKYYAVDEAGNEKTYTSTISVGDCVKPQLTWKEELETTATLGSEFVLDTTKFELDDFGETEESVLRDKLQITMTGPDSTKLTNQVTDGTGYKWKLDSTGKYTLKFTLKDDAGNTNTYTYSITVPEEEVETETVNPAVGVVLVVLSVVVLSGVVVYFVVSSKKKSVKTSKKSK